MYQSEKFRDKYRIPSARLQDWDYASPCLYFITICTKGHHPYFGQIVETQNFASPGQDGQNENINTSQKDNVPSLQNRPHVNVPNTETQNFASLQSSIIGDIANQYWLKIPEHFPFVELDEYVVMPNHVHGILFLNKPDYDTWQPNKFGPQSKNLGSVIRGYKAGVKHLR